MNLFIPLWLIVVCIVLSFIVVLFLIIALGYFLCEWADNLSLFYHGAQRGLDEIKIELQKLKCNRK